MSPELTIFTVTWARDASEEALLERALEALIALGFPVVAADRTDTPAFRHTLARLGVQIVRPADPGLVAQVQIAALAASASQTRYLLYTEPDKELFFRDQLKRFVDCIPAGDETGVILAARSDGSFRTFPPMQQYAETVVNTLCGNAIGTAGDFSYGPFVMHRQLVSHISRLPPTLGWGWRPSTFLAARRSGLRVIHWTADLPCPADQRQEDAGERRHRLVQLSQNVAGLCEE